MSWANNGTLASDARTALEARSSRQFVSNCTSPRRPVSHQHHWQHHPSMASAAARIGARRDGGESRAAALAAAMRRRCTDRGRSSVETRLRASRVTNSVTSMAEVPAALRIAECMVPSTSVSRSENSADASSMSVPCTRIATWRTTKSCIVAASAT